MRIQELSVANLSGLTPTSADKELSRGASQGLDFGRLVADLVQGTADAVAAGEAKAAQGLAGKAAVHEVVQAVMEAERRLTVAIAIRDRIVAAYQEVSRMAI